MKSVVTANSQLIRRTSILFTVLLIICIAIFYLPYKVLHTNTTAALNQQQMILAKQASNGIQAFFNYYENLLTYVASHPHIIAFDQNGEKHLQDLYTIHKEQISAVTRVDAAGRITYTVPSNPEVIGLDVSHQAHNAFIIEKQQPIVSDVFLAVQGYRTVAFAIPVFSNATYAGSLTILVPFEVLSQKYLDGIRLGDDGYAWMLSSKGTELYCPVPGHIGKTIHETSSQFPTVIEVAERMLQGGEGVATYSYDRIREKETETIEKHVAYVPILLPHAIWSIAVATPDHYAFSAVSGFIKWWLLLFLAIVICLVTYIFLYMRSRLITSEGLRRLEAEKQLRKSEKLFQSIIDNAPIPLHVINATGEIELVNQKAIELYGYTKEDIPNTSLWFENAFPDPILRNTLRTKWHKKMRQALDTKRSDAFTAGEHPLRCKDGSTRDVYFDYTLTDDKVTVSLTDRTMQNSMALEKERMLEKEERSRKLEMIGLLAGEVAHDLNNILSGIVSYPDLLISQLPADSELRHPLTRIKESGTRAVSVVDDLLTAARGVASARSTHGIDQLIREYLESPEHEKIVTSYPDITFTHTLAAKGATILCSPVHIKKSLMNLVINGAEAIEGAGEITISSTAVTIDTLSPEADIAPGHYALLRIEDSGPGIPEEEISKVFEPFYSKKSLGKSGSGLGLMIVQNSVEDHGGNIFLESGRSGSVFSIYLPVTHDESDDHEAEHSLRPPSGAGERILVVDDEPLLREIAVQTLTQAGYAVHAVASGEEAVLYIEDNQTDLLLLDMVMQPGMNGNETFQEIRKLVPTQKAIIVSGYSESADIQRAIDLGSGNLLRKPYTRQALLEAVRIELEKN